jgi:hypothetical protein
MAFDKLKFKAHMRSKGISQSNLAELFGVHTRTVCRWLDPKYKINSEIVLALCEAVGSEPEEFDPDWIGSVDTLNKARVSANISSASKNGFWLLKLRYGISEKDIIELAPTMFALVVEHARQSPHDWWEKWESMVKQAELLNMPSPYDPGMEAENANNEIEVLNEDKIFGKEDHEYDSYMPGNLFYQALKRLSNKSSNVEIGSSSPNGECPNAEYNIIDKDLVDAITDGDEELGKAISRGDIQLFSKDAESFSNSVERVKWMKKSYAIIKEEKERKKAENLEKLKISDPHTHKLLTETNEERKKRIGSKLSQKTEERIRKFRKRQANNKEVRQ